MESGEMLQLRTVVAIGRLMQRSDDEIKEVLRRSRFDLGSNDLESLLTEPEPEKPFKPHIKELIWKSSEVQEHEHRYYFVYYDQARWQHHFACSCGHEQVCDAVTYESHRHQWNILASFVDPPIRLFTCMHCSCLAYSTPDGPRPLTINDSEIITWLKGVFDANTH